MNTEINFVYILIKENDWENMVVFLSKEDAIAKSIQDPDCRIEVFEKNNNSYKPTYNCYRNGVYVPYLS
jgi:hypothetical protein